jgi:hypothetical protein
MWGTVVFFVLNIVTIPANTPFNAKWEPIASTVSYRIMIDDMQIGADIPVNIGFPTNVNWTFGPAQAGLHTFEILSIDAQGNTTSLPVSINGSTPPGQLSPPRNPTLKRILYVANVKNFHQDLP